MMCAGASSRLRKGESLLFAVGVAAMLVATADRTTPAGLVPPRELPVRFIPVRVLGPQLFLWFAQDRLGLD